MPISTHPAFPWVVGLYFAVLMAGGLFVMPDAVHTNLRSWLGIEALVGNALAAKLVLSVLAGILGLLVGVAIARRIAGAKANDAAVESDDGEMVVPEIHSDEPAVHDSDHADDAVWLADDLGEETESDEAEETRQRMFNPRDYLADDGLESGSAHQDTEESSDTIESVEPVDAEFVEVDPVADSVHFEAADEDGEAEPNPGDEWIDVGSEHRSEEPEEAAATTTYMPDADQMETQPHPPSSEAMGDLSLSELTGRLERALAAQRVVKEGEAKPVAADTDPVIAFLRREADRTAPAESVEIEDDQDTQASLRSALERLSQVGKRS